MIEELRERVRTREARIKSALRHQLLNGHVLPADEEFMLAMLDRGLIGMDGFKFCELIEAQTNRRIFLEQIEK